MKKLIDRIGDLVAPCAGVVLVITAIRGDLQEVFRSTVIVLLAFVAFSVDRGVEALRNGLVVRVVAQNDDDDGGDEDEIEPNVAVEERGAPPAAELVARSAQLPAAN